LLSRASRIPEVGAPGNAPASATTDELVVVRGLGQFFSGMQAHRMLIRQRMLEVAQPGVAGTCREVKPFLGIHVRRGDFATPSNQDAKLHSRQTYRLPLEWYVSALRAMRDAVGKVPVSVYSDGTDGELGPLLAEPDCVRRDAGTAMGDLLSLSQSAAMIGSNSTFSMWASFVGNVPSVWAPGFPTQDIFPGGQIAHHSPGRAIDETFAEQVSRSVAAWSPWIASSDRP
jgi:hypothetical protein